MKRTAKIAAIVSGGAIAAGAFAVPALASDPGHLRPARPRSRSCTARGTGDLAGNGIQLRTQDRDATCVHLPASGTLITAQRAEPTSMAQNEKLAYDLYAQFYQAYHLRVCGCAGVRVFGCSAT